MLEAERKPTHLTLQVAASIGLQMFFGTHIFHFVLSICYGVDLLPMVSPVVRKQLLRLLRISRSMTFLHPKSAVKRILVNIDQHDGFMRCIIADVRYMEILSAPTGPRRVGT